jgi:hypothetical protein
MMPRANGRRLLTRAERPAPLLRPFNSPTSAREISHSKWELSSELRPADALQLERQLDRAHKQPSTYRTDLARPAMMAVTLPSVVLKRREYRPSLELIVNSGCASS